MNPLPMATVLRHVANGMKYEDAYRTVWRGLVDALPVKRNIGSIPKQVAIAASAERAERMFAYIAANPGCTMADIGAALGCTVTERNNAYAKLRMAKRTECRRDGEVYRYYAASAPNSPVDGKVGVLV